MLRFIRLKSSEDIVAEVEKDTEKNGVYVLNNPLRVYYQYSHEPNDASYYIVMSPWIYPSMVKKQQFAISINEIVTMGEPTDQLVKLFNRTIEKMYEVPESSADELDKAGDDEKKKAEDFVSKSLSELKNKRLH